MNSILAASSRYIVEKQYEHVILKERSTNRIIFIDKHIGDARKAVLSPKEDWCVVGGAGLSVWKQDTKLVRLMESPLMFVHDLKLVGDNTLKILIDPWSEHASIWLLDLRTLELKKEATGPDLRGNPYTEVVDF